MSTRPRLTRRSLLRSASAAGAGVFTGTSARPSRAANDRLQTAFIGTANRATDNINGINGQAIVALCDIDDTYLDRLTKSQAVSHKEGDKVVQKEASARLADARTYHDYRDLIDKEAGKVDAVVVSTADHHHAPTTIRTIRSKMHVYCEKPLAHTVAEARIVAEGRREWVSPRRWTRRFTPGRITGASWRSSARAPSAL